MKTPVLNLVLFTLGSAVSSLLCAAPPPAVTPAGYVPCKIIEKTPALFPVRLLQNGVTRGEACLRIEIDSTGQLTDALVTAYTRREFADEAQRVLRRWVFEPGTVNGAPVISIMNLDFVFETNGVIAYVKTLDSVGQDLAGGDYTYQAHGPKTLDAAPVPVESAVPVYPKEWASQGRSGKVMVDFFIDETGRPRVPAVANPGDDLLAASAVAAVKQSRFQGPTYQGQPVLAHVQREFVFGPGTPAQPKP